MTPIPNTLASDRDAGDDDPGINARSEAPSPSAPGSEARLVILVIEDEAAQRIALCERLRMDGYESLWARDPAEAREALAKDAPRIDIIIGDLKLTRSDHAALVREIRGSARYAALPIIITSGATSHAAYEAAQRAGINEYIDKPFSHALLLQLIVRWTGARS